MQKGFITPAVALILGTLLIGAPLVAWYTAEPEPQMTEEQSFGGFNDPFISYQLATTTLTNGNVLQTDGTNSFWVSTSSLGIVGGGGSGLTSLNSQTGSSQTFATGTATGIGLTITSGSDIHTFTPTVLSGYAIPLTASTTEWATAYSWGNHATAGYDQVTTAGDGLTRTVNDFDCDIASGSVFGCLSSADWTTFNNKETTLTFSDGLTRTTNNIAPTAGYVIPLSASTTNWNTFYDTPSNRITAGTNLTWSGNTLNVDDPFTVTDLTATNATTTRLYVGGESTFNATSTWAAGIHPIMHGIYAADSSGLHLHSNNGTEVAFFGAGGGANITFPNYTSALLQTGVSGALAEYAGTACTNQFVRSLSALAAATCAAVNLTSDVTGILPIANGGTGTSTAPSLGQVLLGNASGGYNLVATSSLGITASAGGANTQLQYNSGGALAGLSTLTTDGSSLTMTGTSTLATTTVSNLLLPSGGTINWNSGDAILTHSSNQIALSGANLRLGVGSYTDIGASGITVSDGTDDVVISPSSINWNSSDITLTRSSNLLTIAGGGLTVGGTSTLATTTASRLTVSEITSALGLFDSTGLLTEYTGIDCTNQFVRDVSAAGAGTCASVSLSADVTGTLPIANGGTGNTTATAAFAALSPLSTKGDLLTVNGVGNQARVPVGSDDAFLLASSTNTNGLAWEGATRVASVLESAIEAALDTLTNLTNVAVSTVLQIPNGTGPTCNDPGEVCHDTTDNQLILDDYVVAKAVDTIFKVTVASTSPAFTNSGLLKVPTELDGFTITAIRCSVETGTSKVVAIEDASGNSSEDITCGTTVTSDDGSITNASYTAGEELYIDFGATSGSVDYVSISVFGTWSRE